MRTNPQAGTEPMLLTFACSPDEADRREPIMMVSTDSIEVRDMRCHLNVPPLGLCEALSDGLRGGGKTNAAMYQAEATITMAARDGKAFMELVDAGGWTKQVAKPRSKRGQRVRRWR